MAGLLPMNSNDLEGWYNSLTDEDIEAFRRGLQRSGVLFIQAVTSFNQLSQTLVSWMQNLNSQTFAYIGANMQQFITQISCSIPIMSAFIQAFVKGDNMPGIGVKDMLRFIFETAKTSVHTLKTIRKYVGRDTFMRAFRYLFPNDNGVEGDTRGDADTGSNVNVQDLILQCINGRFN